MRILFILDSVENPTSANVLMAQRLAGVLCAAGHTVHLLELWDGLHPQPELPGCTVHCLAFADERLMNAALENGHSGGSPIPVRLARLCCHPTAVAAAFRQLVLKQPRRTVDSRREIERLDAEFHFDAVCAVCAPYRTAFALEAAAIRGKKFLWQLDPYASNRDYTAPGGFAREGQLLDALDGTFVTPQALSDYADGAPLALNADNDLLPTASIPSRLRPVWFGIDAANADVRAVDVVTGANGTTFKIIDTQYGTFDAAIPTAGIHTVYDALAAYAAATRLGLDAARCAAALATYRTTGMRQHIVEKGGITFIEDCYNASPDSMKAALSVLKALPNARKIALLGDMLELGGASEEGHRHTGEWAADAGVDALIAYGPRSAAMAEAAKARGVAAVHCQTAEEVLQYVRQFVRPGDAVLVKASHSMGLEQLLQEYYKELPQG